MSKDISITVDELSDLTYQELLRKFEVTDDQAQDSELEGDSDADDGFPSSILPLRKKIHIPPGEEHTESDGSIGHVSSGSTPGGSSDNTEDLTEESSSGVEPSSASISGESDSNDEIDDQPVIRPWVDVEEDMASSSEDDGTQEEIFIPKWIKEGEGPEISHKFKQSEFKQPFGAKVAIDIANIMNIYFLFFNESFFNDILLQSNLYADQKGHILSLTKPEFCSFLGILIIMGFHQLPSIRHYWSINENFGVPRIARVMTLRRFLTILRYLHINDNSKMPERNSLLYDKLYKIRPMLDHFCKIFKEIFDPSRYLSVDESMIAFKGRSTLKQYMPFKPIKRGFKIWALCCSVTGYLVALQFYEGKVGDRKVPLGERVVLDLVKSFETFAYCLYFDRFFSSFALIKKLLAKGFYACGTILQSRKYFPSHLLKTDRQLKYGESDYCSTKDFGLVKWKDRGAKSVSVLSSMDDPASFTKIKRKLKTGEKVEVNCPNSIVDYNKHMGGVDLFDQLMSYYCTQWKSRRWWMKAFYYFLDASIVNAYILYKEEIKKNNESASKNKKRKKKGSQSLTKPLSQLMFRSMLADELIGEFSKRKIPPKKVHVTKKKFSSTLIKTEVDQPQGHQPTKLANKTQRRCARCSTKKHPKKSVYICATCDVGLCIGTCFKAYHDDMSN